MIAEGHQPSRVLIVDDSPTMRALLKRLIEQDRGLTVVGAAESSDAARQMITRLRPDVLTLDVELPDTNGLDFLSQLMTSRPMPVVMVSCHTQSGADATLAALRIGAVDVVAKPNGRDELDSFAECLRDRVAAAAKSRVSGPIRSRPATMAAPKRSYARSLIAIGASTGGVSALTDVLEGLPPNLPPIVIVQHMPQGYTARFAERLRTQLGRNIAEAKDGEALVNGCARIAPAGRHLRIHRSGRSLTARLSDDDPISGHRPSVDALFASVANATARTSVGVILTGMGRDGAEGLKAMRHAGAYTLGQGPDSCVVYGMPRAAKAAGAVAEEIELARMAERIAHAATIPPS